METKDIKEPSDWQPMKAGKVTAAMGKLIEELGEATSAVARCYIQGIDEKSPDTGKVNRQWMLDELADVRAMTDLVLSMINVTDGEMLGMWERCNRKLNMKQKWMEMVKDD